MIIIKNILHLNPETLYHKMDTEFAAYINEKLGSNLAITFQHVFDVINVYFPEILPDTAFTLTVTAEEVTISNNAAASASNTALLEEHLEQFITIAVS